MKKRKMRLSIGTGVLTALFLATAMSAFASKLVEQTWLPGIDIATQYGQYVDEVPKPARVNGANHLTISEQEFQQRMLPSTFKYPAPFIGTYLWGFGATEDGPVSTKEVPPAYPGPTVVTERYPKDDPRSLTHVLYDNELKPAPGQDSLVLQRYLTVDQTLHWANPLGDTSMAACENVDCTASATPGTTDPCCVPYLGPVPVTVHLHGSETPSAYDGHPDTWWTPDLQQTGPAFVDNNYTYTNTMQPTTLWYHDHALGMTRINIYSGLAGFYFIRGEGDTGSSETGLHLPSGDREREIVIADRMFDTNGQLLFPDGTPPSNPNGLNGAPPNPDIHPYWIPEFFGDVNVVNGMAWPKMTVKPMRYRFRILNGSNARFYNLKLSGNVPGKSSDNASPPQKSAHAPTFWVIGAGGGLLDKPVKVSQLLIGPAERYDVVVDFGAFAGQKIELTNDAPAPYPGGGSPFDPRTNGRVMQFQVQTTHQGPDTTFNPASPKAKLRDNGADMLPPIVRLVDGKGGLAPRRDPLQEAPTGPR